METSEKPIPLDYQHSPGQQPLTRYDAAVLALRLVAIYMLFQALAQLTAFGINMLNIFGNSRLDALLNVWPYGLLFVVIITASLLLWILAPRLAHWLLPNIAVGARPLSAGAAQLQVIAFSVVGVILIVTGLPRLAESIWFWRADYDKLAPTSLNASLNIGSLLQIIIGVGLFLGARGLSLAWHRIRREPMPDETRDPPPGEA